MTIYFALFFIVVHFHFVYSLPSTLEVIYGQLLIVSHFISQEISANGACLISQSLLFEKKTKNIKIPTFSVLTYM